MREEIAYCAACIDGAVEGITVWHIFSSERSWDIAAIRFVWKFDKQNQSEK
jgi:hypothetical protein